MKQWKWISRTFFRQRQTRRKRNKGWLNSFEKVDRAWTGPETAFITDCPFKMEIYAFICILYATKFMKLVALKIFWSPSRVFIFHIHFMYNFLPCWGLTLCRLNAVYFLPFLRYLKKTSCFFMGWNRKRMKLIFQRKTLKIGVDGFC